LLLAVVVTGTTPSITTPAGWTAIQNNVAPTGLACGLFLLNGPGNVGITGVTVTVGGSGGGAVAALFNFIGASPATVDASGTQNGTGTSYSNFTVGVALPAGELLFYMVGFAAATLTPSNNAAWSGVLGAVVSTNGTPNAQLGCFIVFNSGQVPFPSLGGSLSASVVNQENQVHLGVPGTFTPVIGPGGATFVGQSLNPAGPLEVPQPIGTGSFYSGTSGSF
jgi:hypothetical protein